MSEPIVDRVPGGRIVGYSDEGFAPAENLLATREPEFRFGVFIPGKGQEFDSWETRRLPRAHGAAASRLPAVTIRSRSHNEPGSSSNRSCQTA